jgi:hypothetical protein
MRKRRVRGFSIAFAFAATLVAVACRGGDVPAAAPEEKPPGSAYEVRAFPTEADALKAIVAEAHPAIFGFGEYHQLDATTATRSAIARFSESLLPVIAGGTSDLVVETWFSAGNCGKAEKQVVKKVDEVSERPAETADETVVLLRRAQALGVAPHILGVTCEDYAKVLVADGGLDYFAFLELVATRLGDEAEAIAKAAKPTAAAQRKAIAIYGGAMHNDLAPREGFEAVSFAERMRALGVGPYAEIDFLIPEFIVGSAVAREEPWFGPTVRSISREHAALIERGPGSYIILARAGVASPPPSARIPR